MCSIGGFISSRPLSRYTARNLLSALIWYGQDRGNQSAGCYYNGQLAKRAMLPSSFLEHSDFFNLFTHDGSMGLTHTRFPTSGAYGDAQAQPFQLGRTITVHNGMFWDIPSLKREWSIAKPSGVDSELITSIIHTLGPSKLPDFIESTDGPSAIAAIHNDKLYLLRSGNPTWFHIINLDDGAKVLVFASTEEQLERALRHTWLIADPFRANGTQQNVLLSAEPGRLTQLGRKIKPPSFSSPYSWGIHNYDTGDWRKYLGEEAADASRRIQLAARNPSWDGE